MDTDLDDEITRSRLIFRRKRGGCVLEMVKVIAVPVWVRGEGVTVKN